MSKTQVRIEGNVSAVGASGEVVAGGGSYTFPTAGRLHSIVSADANDSDSIRASGTVQVNDYTGLSGETFTIDGNVLTEGVDWAAATSNDATATSLAAAIDAISGFSASAATDTVTIIYDTRGAAGNSIAMSTSDGTDLTLSGANLSGGNDSPSGAHTVLVEGVLATGVYASETVILDGLTPVNTTSAYAAINKMTVTEAGSGKTNAGAITATAATDSTVSSTIKASEGQSADAVYAVPSGYDLWLNSLECFLTGATATKAIKTSVKAGVLLSAPQKTIHHGGCSGEDGHSRSEFHLVVPAGSIVFVSYAATGSTFGISVALEGNLIRRN